MISCNSGCQEQPQTTQQNSNKIFVVKKKSTKIAFEGDILQAWRLTDDTITDILDPHKNTRRKFDTKAPKSSKKFVETSADCVDEQSSSPQPLQKRITLREKPKTVSFIQNMIVE